MRGQGRVFRPVIGGRESKVWWLDYGVNGVRHRESSKTTSKREALDILRQRIGDRKERRLVGRPEKVTLADLKAALETHYVVEGNASWKRAAQAFAHITEYFGPDARAVELDDERVAEYQQHRLAAGAARNSVKYETGVLNAAFGAAKKRLGRRITFKNLPDDKAAVRQGFFSGSDFGALVVNLPRDLGDLVTFLYMTGWRRNEGAGLLWAQVDWDDEQYPGEHDEPVPGPRACVTISAAQTKGGDVRVFPIGDARELRDLLLARWRVRNGLRVFHRKGKPIGDFRKVWAKACKAAGLEGRLVHDLRRSAARDFRRAGVSEGVIMALAGWRTRAMFDRYDVKATEDLERGVARRFCAKDEAPKDNSTENGKQTANNSASAA